MTCSKSSPPSENKFALHINSYTYHFSRADQNESTLGIGFSYLFRQVKSERTFLDNNLLTLEADIYKDSSSNVGYSGGHPGKFRYFKHSIWASRPAWYIKINRQMIPGCT